MARRMVAQSGGASSGAHGVRLRATGLFVALGLLLAACGSGGSSSAATATSTIPAGQATATLASATTTPATNPTATPASVAQSGSLDICQPVTPTPVQISVPAEIPVYQSGQIKLAEANTTTNTSEFGFCIPDSVSAVASFYTHALPGKGWDNLNTFINLGTENVTATRGSSETVTITISPDTLQQGNTDLLIILQGQ